MPSPMKLSLPAPAAVSSQLAAARDRGVNETKTWLADNPKGNQFAFAHFITAGASQPPDAAGQAEELQLLHKVAKARTPEHDAQAAWVDGPGLRQIWKGHAASYLAQAGPDQAAKGAALLELADKLSSRVTFALKKSSSRLRPFQADTSLPLSAGITHVTNASFPSGHASMSYSHSTLLGALWPQQAAALDKDAEQVSFARNYAAAHFPSDVAAGAYIGAAAATYALSGRK